MRRRQLTASLTSFGLLTILLTGCGESFQQGSNEIIDQQAAEVSATTATSPEAALVFPLYKIGEDAVAGNLTFRMDSFKRVTKAEEQYIVIQLSVTNNDKKALVISGSMFELEKDTYDATVYIGTGPNPDIVNPVVSVFDDLRPGLTQTGTVIFKTPKSFTNFTLRCDTGVLLSGGKPVSIDSWDGATY